MKSSTAEKLLKLNYDLYEHQAQSFSKTRSGGIWEQEILDFVSKIPAGSSVLDLGCGNGRLCDAIAKHGLLNGFKNGSKQINTSCSRIRANLGIIYLGIDSSKELITQARKKYRYVKFEVNDVLKIKYKNKFNYIISIAVLHHIPSEKLQLKFLKNIHQALKPKGKTFISVWNRWSDRYKKYSTQKYKNNMIKILPRNSASLSALFREISFADLLVPWKQSGYFRYIHAFKPVELKSLAQKAGFKKIECFASKHGVKTKLKEALNIYLIASK